MRLLDVARGGYARSPLWLRRAAGPAIALIPPALQYGGTYSRWRKEIAESERSAAFTKERQLTSLQKLVARATGASSYWQERFAEDFGGKSPAAAGFSLDMLRTLRPIGRADVETFAEAMLTVPIEETDAGYSSGSSGKPLAFYLDKDRSPKEWAFIMNAWSRCGYREKDARCVFRALSNADLGGNPYEWEPALRELRLSPWSLTGSRLDLYVDLIDRHKIRYLHGYPSCMEIFCRHLLRSGRRPRRPIRGVFVISEPIWSHQRQLFGQCFPEAAVISQFGLSERTAFAADGLGPEGEFWFEPLYGVTELLDANGETVSEPGKRGRIVATGFLSVSMPLFRYDTGDTAALVELPSETNRYRLKVRDIVPKSASIHLVGREGQRFDADWCVQHGKEAWKGVSEYQFYQDKPGVAELRMVAANGAGEAGAAQFIAAVRRSVGDSLEIVPRMVDAVETNTRGKRKLAIQKLDLSKF